MAFKREIDLINDPILSGIINCLQVSNYTKIKKKSRILLPNSANLLGVIDSTGTLAPNEVFIQIKQSNFDSTNTKNDTTINQIIQEIVAKNKNNNPVFSQQETKDNTDFDFSFGEINNHSDSDCDSDYLSTDQS